MSILLAVFLTFAKIGLFSFGGGYAMILLIEHNCVDDRKWITHDEYPLRPDTAAVTYVWE